MAICEKCKSKVFFVDETATYLEVDGEIIKHLGDTTLFNRNCVRCTYRDQYDDYKQFDEVKPVASDRNEK